MLKFAVNHAGPIAVRYPRGSAFDGLEEYQEPIALGKSEWIFKGSDLALLAIGSMVATGEQVREVLKTESCNPSLVNMRFAKPLDEARLDELAKDHRVLVTMEENVLSGGMGERVRAYVNSRYPQMRVISIGIPDQFVGHGSVDQLKKQLHLDAKGIVSMVKEQVDR